MNRMNGGQTGAARRVTKEIEILGPVSPTGAEILTPEALAFLAFLERSFRRVREALLARRLNVQGQLDAGTRPDFLPGTRWIRERDWKVGPLPDDLRDRRVEITGPVDRKMIINALNSDASVFMADFEDSLAPTWHNVLEGQVNVRDAVRGGINWRDHSTGKEYRLAMKTAVLAVRPRGWHLPENHVLVDGEPVSAALFDFALTYFHNARMLLARGSGPYFYLPKIESYLEARLWAEVFVAAEHAFGLRRGTIKATVLIETILAAFQMDEILWELRDHAVGLNFGRWDYIFSFVKKLRADPNCLLPDRGQVTMDQHFLHSCSLLLVQTCHRRGALALGGMAAQIPVKEDPERHHAALEHVRADKRREVGLGHDGTWVAHPGLVAAAREEFDRGMPGPNQLHVLHPELSVTAADLLAAPRGTITEAGLRHNLEVGVRYLESWLRGNGCVPLHDLMEDAATAEIARAQVWQWIRHDAYLADGRVVTADLARQLLAQEVARMPGNGRLAAAAGLFERLITAPQLADFLTLAAYDHLLAPRAAAARNP